MIRRRSALTTIARTGERFSDFAPYVASIAGNGTVAFQAELTAGGTGLFAGTGTDVADVSASAASMSPRWVSHPDIDDGGAVSAYATFADGSGAVLRIASGVATAVARTGGELARIGPLGPTTNGAGDVAFRADLSRGGSGIFVARGGAIATIASTPAYAGFEGLPVVGDGGEVVFRADLPGGGHALFSNATERIRTGGEFAELGRFPTVNGVGAIAFAARRSDGSAGVFVCGAEQTTCIHDTSGAFESFRGALIDDGGRLVFFAVSRGGTFGVYAGPDPETDAIVCLGDDVHGSAVVELALNPVSINAAGQVAIRLRLADGRQVIVRADP